MLTTKKGIDYYKLASISLLTLLLISVFGLGIVRFSVVGTAPIFTLTEVSKYRATTEDEGWNIVGFEYIDDVVSYTKNYYVQYWTGSGWAGGYSASLDLLYFSESVSNDYINAIKGLIAPADYIIAYNRHYYDVNFTFRLQLRYKDESNNWQTIYSNTLSYVHTVTKNTEHYYGHVYSAPINAIFYPSGGWSYNTYGSSGLDVAKGNQRIGDTWSIKPLYYGYSSSTQAKWSGSAWTMYPLSGLAEDDYLMITSIMNGTATYVLSNISTVAYGSPTRTVVINDTDDLSGDAIVAGYYAGLVNITYVGTSGTVHAGQTLFCVRLYPPADTRIHVDFTSWAITYHYAEGYAPYFTVTARLVKATDGTAMGTTLVELVYGDVHEEGSTNSTGYIIKSFACYYYDYSTLTVHGVYAGSSEYFPLDESHDFTVTDSRMMVYYLIILPYIDSRTATHTKYMTMVSVTDYYQTNPDYGNVVGYYISVVYDSQAQFSGYTDGSGHLSGLVTVLTSAGTSIQITIYGTPSDADYGVYKSKTQTLTKTIEDPRIPVTVEYTGDTRISVGEYPYFSVKVLNTVTELYLITGTKGFATVRIHVGYLSYPMVWNGTYDTWCYNSLICSKAGDNPVWFEFNGSSDYRPATLGINYTGVAKNAVTIEYTGDTAVDVGEYPHLNVKLLCGGVYIEEELGSVTVRISGTTYDCEWNGTSYEWCYNSYVPTSYGSFYAYFSFSGTDALLPATLNQRITVAEVSTPVTIYVQVLNGTTPVPSLNVDMIDVTSAGESYADTQQTNSTGYAEFSDVPTNLGLISAGATSNGTSKATVFTPTDGKVVTLQFGTGTMGIDLSALMPMVAMIAAVGVIGAVIGGISKKVPM